MKGIIYLLIIVSGVILCIISRKETYREKEQGREKKTEVFERMALYIYHVLCKRGRHSAKGRSSLELFMHIPQVDKDLRIIQPGKKMDNLQETYYVEKLRLFLMLFYLGSLLALFVYLSGAVSGILMQGRSIAKNTYGGGDIYTNVWVETEDGKYGQMVEVTISEKKYMPEELDELYREAIAHIEQQILNGNAGIDCVKTNLYLPESLEGYPFKLKWESSDYFLMNHEGEIQNAGNEQSGNSLILTCTFSYGEWEKEYQFPVFVYEKEKSEQELWEEQIHIALRKADENSRYKDLYLLPEQIEDKTVVWREIKKEYSLEILFLLLLAAIGIYFLKDQDLHKKVLERNVQMLEEHPILVNRLVLYIGAGMTIKGAIFKLAMDYQTKKEQKGYYHYTYEELLFTCYEMQSGVSESNAYESLGKRCGLQPYTRLIGLLIQSLKKGNAALLKDLQKEAEEAQEERRSQARKRGEEAGTKLLLPMMMLLGIVMVIIMVPAFLSF